MRTKKVALNAVFSALSLLTSSLLSLVVTREIIYYLGSDYNGLNSTIAQFLTVLMLVESGFTLATLVKLYKPYGAEDYLEVNRILSKAREDLIRIGLKILMAGAAGAAVYALFIKTEAPYPVVLLLFLFSVFSTAFNFFYTYKYRLLYQVSQTEYLVQLVNTLANVVTYGGMILLIRRTENILAARGYQMLCSVATGLILGALARRKFPFADFHTEHQGVTVEGTRDLLVSKVCSMLYSSLTVFYMSVFVGTVYTSVYAVYNSVVSLVTSYLQSMLAAPQNALGQVIYQEKGRFKKIFAECEYVTVLLSCVLLSTTLVLLLPFVRLYTRGVTDVDYIMPALGLVMVLTSFLQMVHIPSGQCIELSGRFRIVKRIQLMATLCLLVFSSAGAFLFGFMGLLLAKLATNVILAVVEIVYTHTQIAENTLGQFLGVLLPNSLFALALTAGGYCLLREAEMSVLGFLFSGAATLLLIGVLMLLFNGIFYKDQMARLFQRVRLLLASRRNRGAAE